MEEVRSVNNDLPGVSQALKYFTADQMDLIISGLISLEGSLTALNHPVPKTLGDLKSGLTRAREKKSETQKSVLTTKEAAEILRCSIRHVRHLAKIGRIIMLEHGNAGRGRSNLYEASSVTAYAKERRKWRQEDAKP